jgi:hypothetical protein
MYVVVWDGCVIGSYKTEVGAKIALKRKWAKRYVGAVVMDYQTFRAQDVMVDSINLMSGKPIKVRRSEKGGPLDPGTETYWSS